MIAAALRPFRGLRAAQHPAYMGRPPFSTAYQLRVLAVGLTVARNRTYELTVSSLRETPGLQRVLVLLHCRLSETCSSRTAKPPLAGRDRGGRRHSGGHLRSGLSKVRRRAGRNPLIFLRATGPQSL